MKKFFWIDIFKVVMVLQAKMIGICLSYCLRLKTKKKSKIQTPKILCKMNLLENKSTNNIKKIKWPNCQSRFL